MMMNYEVYGGKKCCKIYFLINESCWTDSFFLEGGGYMCNCIILTNTVPFSGSF